MPQRRPPSTSRIVVVRRRSPVVLQTAPVADKSGGVMVYADGRLIARLDTDAELVPAVAGLLSGPTWLLLVAARLPVHILGRLWVLVPAQPSAPGAAPLELRDDDEVYAYLLAEVVRPAEAPDSDDLATEAGRLLESATAPGPR